MDPVLTQRDPLLDDDGLLQAVQADLVQRLPASATDGRPSTPVEVRLRMLAVARQHVGRPPDLLPGDRGLSAAANEREASTQGVTEVVLPTPGKKSAKRLAHERYTWFRAGRNWRAGIEGRLSGLKRRHTLDWCGYRGTAGMERWVGLGVLAHTPRVIAQHLTVPRKTANA